MLSIRLTAEAANDLQTILAGEEDGACVRLREFRLGSCWTKNLQIVLRLSIDGREDEDLVGRTGPLTFVMSRELAALYGRSFSVYLDENRVPSVKRTEKKKVR